MAENYKSECSEVIQIELLMLFIFLQELLNDLITRRNKCRISLHGALTQFINNIGQLPLHQRKLQLLVNIFFYKINYIIIIST